MQSPVTIWRRQKKDKLQLGKRGAVVSWTNIFVAPPRFQHETPYYVVLVKLEDQSLIYGQLVECEGKDVRIGMRVTSILRTIGSVEAEDLVEYGIKFKPERT